MCKAGKSKILISDIFSFIYIKFNILQMDMSRRNSFTKSCRKGSEVGTTLSPEAMKKFEAFKILKSLFFPVFEILVHTKILRIPCIFLLKIQEYLVFATTKQRPITCNSLDYVTACLPAIDCLPSLGRPLSRGDLRIDLLKHNQTQLFISLAIYQMDNMEKPNHVE